MAAKVYIDGREGTTGLLIHERLKHRQDIELLEIDEELRKDSAERKRLINMSDFTVLCLPDEAAIEAVSMVDDPNVRIIDASTAHRTKSDWAYGLPELSEKHRENIKNSKRVAVPGCHASGFIALTYPLIKNGILQPHYPVFAYAITGYSGGGKTRIREYQDPQKSKDLQSPMIYALAQEHKHIPEMQQNSGLAYRPMFTPIISNYHSGLTVAVPIQSRLLNRRVTIKDFWDILDKNYAGQTFVKVQKLFETQRQNEIQLPSNYLRGTNKMDIFIFGSNEQMLLCACLDNLGKGASGAAVQCLNIMLGIDETTGLVYN